MQQHLDRVPSLRALERALLACFRAPFGASAPGPLYRAYIEEVVPLLDPQVKQDFARTYQRARKHYKNAAAAMGYTLAWTYDALRQEGEEP